MFVDPLLVYIFIFLYLSPSSIIELINYKLNNVWFNIHNFPQERVTMCKKRKRNKKIYNEKGKKYV